MNHDSESELKADVENGSPMVVLDQEKPDAGDGQESGDTEPAAFSLAEYHDDDYLTKAGMRHVFRCADRTVFRMVDRFEIPPPMPLAGRSVWVVGRLKTWIANSAQLRENEAMKEAKRLSTL